MGRLEAILDRRGATLGRLDALLDCLGALFGPSWAVWELFGGSGGPGGALMRPEAPPPLIGFWTLGEGEQGEGNSQMSHMPFHPRQAGVGGFSGCLTLPHLNSSSRCESYWAQSKGS